jgi:hypothetical protein
MSVAKSHKRFGPLILNWEGGYSGERKIQEIKPLLSIKRENADWQRIALQRLYQLETIKKILQKTTTIQNIGDKDNKIINTRMTEGLLKIFSNRKVAIESIVNCLPLSAIVDVDDRVWIAYRPNDGASDRSALTICEIQFNDSSGNLIQDICWFAPINITDITIRMSSISEANDFAKEYALLLPYPVSVGNTFINSYYGIGSNWTERDPSGNFIMSELNINKTFSDWLPSNAL